MTRPRNSFFCAVTVFVWVSLAVLGQSAGAVNAAGAGKAAQPVLKPADPLAQTAVQACVPGLADMVSYWALNDGSGAATFQDSAGGNNGSCTGAGCPVYTASGINGGAFTFDGVGSSVIIPNASNLEWADAATAGFTIELWVNTTQTSTSNRVFIGKKSATSTSTASWWVGRDSTGAAAFYLRDSNNSGFILKGSAVADGRWHHVVAEHQHITTASGSDVNLLYVDGVAQAIDASYTGSFMNGNSVTLGSFYDNTPAYFFQGSLDEVAIYNRALTADEVKLHYSAGTGRSYCDSPPAAGAASFSSMEDTDLTIAASSLLANTDDPDNALNPAQDPLTISSVEATSAQGGMVLGSGPFVYSPAPDFNGADTFHYTVSDSRGLTATGLVTINVAPVNDAPQVAQPADQANLEWDQISLQVQAVHPDPNQAVTFSADNLPPNLTINPTTGLISGEVYHTAAQSSPYHVIVRATDALGKADEKAFTWTVQHYNRPPVVTGPGSQTSDPGSAVSLQIVAVDPENQPVSYSAQNLPSGLSINPGTGLISGTLAPGIENTYIVQLTVSDGESPLTLIFNWTVGKPKIFVPSVYRYLRIWEPPVWHKR